MKAEIPIPEDIKAGIDGGVVSVKGKFGSIERRFRSPLAGVSIENRKFVVSSDGQQRRYKKTVNTFRSHLRNMIAGASKGYSCELKLVQTHFPYKVGVKDGQITIENFIGEKRPRTAECPKNVKVVVQGKGIVVEGADKEAVSRTALALEQVTRISAKDRRVFQDGIFITKKAMPIEEAQV